MIDQIATAAKTIAARLHSRGIERTQGEVIRYVVDVLKRHDMEVSDDHVCRILAGATKDEMCFRLLLGEMVNR